MFWFFVRDWASHSNCWSLKSARSIIWRSFNTHLHIRRGIFTSKIVNLSKCLFETIWSLPDHVIQWVILQQQCRMLQYYATVLKWMGRRVFRVEQRWRRCTYRQAPKTTPCSRVAVCCTEGGGYRLLMFDRYNKQVKKYRASIGCLYHLSHVQALKRGCSVLKREARSSR